MKTFIQTVLFISIMLVLTWVYANAAVRTDGICYNQGISNADNCDTYIIMD